MKILLLIPTCMCGECGCIGKIDKNGYVDCITSDERKCENCQVLKIKNYCNNNKILYRISGKSAVKKIIEEVKPDVTIGIACKSELIRFENELDYKINLTKSKCIDKCERSEMDLEDLELLESVKNGL